MIIARYITKELTWTFLTIAGLLLLIAMSNRFAVYLAKVATGELPVGLVFKIMMLYLPELMSLLVPFSLFVALLFALGRLHADSEMTVLWTAGIGWGTLTRIILLFSVPIMLFIGWYMLWMSPIVLEMRDKTWAEAEAKATIQSLVPGRFQILGDGRMVLYVADTAPLSGIFIAERPRSEATNADGNFLLMANGADVKKMGKDNKDYIIWKEGTRYQGNPGKANFSVVEFEEYGRSIDLSLKPSGTESFKLKTPTQLWQSSDRQDKGELQWRISLPLTIPILALLALPLARVHPRQGRFAKFLPALVIYIIYYNLLAVSKRWVIAGSLSSWIGVWWVHGIILSIALILLAKESGFWQEFRGKNRNLS